MEYALEAVVIAWEWLVEQVTDRFGGLAGTAIFFLPWLIIGLVVWLLIMLAYQ